MKQEEIQESTAPPEANRKEVQERVGPTMCPKDVGQTWQRVRMRIGFGNMANTGNLENRPRNTVAENTQLTIRDYF